MSTATSGGGRVARARTTNEPTGRTQARSASRRSAQLSKLSQKSVVPLGRIPDRRRIPGVLLQCRRIPGGRDSLDESAVTGVRRVATRSPSTSETSALALDSAIVRRHLRRRQVLAARSTHRASGQPFIVNVITYRSANWSCRALSSPGPMAAVTAGRYGTPLKAFTVSALRGRFAGTPRLRIPQ